MRPSTNPSGPTTDQENKWSGNRPIANSKCSIKYSRWKVKDRERNQMLIVCKERKIKRKILPVEICKIEEKKWYNGKCILKY